LKEDGVIKTPQKSTSVWMNLTMQIEQLQFKNPDHQQFTTILGEEFERTRNIDLNSLAKSIPGILNYIIQRLNSSQANKKDQGEKVVEKCS
jgi:hypothetical protein